MGHDAFTSSILCFDVACSSDLGQMIGLTWSDRMLAWCVLTMIMTVCALPALVLCWTGGSGEEPLAVLFAWPPEGGH